MSMAQSSDFGPFGGQRGFVYTETNGTNNAVLVFNRAANGSLSLAATVPTGGLGGGVVSVGSQGALALSQDRRWLFVANEGDGSISVMERTPAGLQVGYNGELSLLGNGVTAQTPGAPLDNALTRNGRYMYLVTGGGSIIGYQVQADGSLTSLNLTMTVPAGSRGLVAQ
jgi:6-phosphogluconolactonase (cycloisomerase 2 family)